jgi:hypothetical protein
MCVTLHQQPAPQSHVDGILPAPSLELVLTHAALPSMVRLPFVLRAIHAPPHPPSQPLAVLLALISAAFASESSLTHNPTAACESDAIAARKTDIIIEIRPRIFFIAVTFVL